MNISGKQSLSARAPGAPRVVVLALLLLGPAARPALAGPAPDDWITTRAKIALWTAARIDSTVIHVDTSDGRVTLSGKVRSDTQRQRSEAVVHDVPGVKTIRNLLQVVPETNEKSVDVADGKVRDDAAAALKADPGLAGSSIVVKSVNRGAVLLSGKASDLFDYLRALDVVNDVAGVRRIDSEVVLPEKPNQNTRTAAAGAKDAALDDWITTDTKLRLIADSEVPALDVSVDTRRGMVTLFGIVPTAASSASAEADARKVDGVLGVDNQLQVVARMDKPEVDQKDDAIRARVRAALKEVVSFKHVDVAVHNGVARLTGHVESSWDRLHAAIVARGSRGVRAVNDDLHLSHS